MTFRVEETRHKNIPRVNPIKVFFGLSQKMLLSYFAVHFLKFEESQFNDQILLKSHSTNEIKTNLVFWVGQNLFDRVDSKMEGDSL